MYFNHIVYFVEPTLNKVIIMYIIFAPWSPNEPNEELTVPPGPVCSKTRNNGTRNSGTLNLEW